MTDLPACLVEAIDRDAIASIKGRIVVFAEGPAGLDRDVRWMNRLTSGALLRLFESESFARAEDGELRELTYPAGLAAEAVLAVKLSRKADALTARRAGAAIAKAAGGQPALLLAGRIRAAEQVALGAMLGAYAFRECKSAEMDDAPQSPGPFTFAVSAPDDLAPRIEAVRPLAEGVAFTRDLVNLPANLLTTTAFADKLRALSALGVEVEVLEEADLAAQKMEMMLSVGHGSDSPSKMVVMRWSGGAVEAAPLVLIGKGVVFDAGGISLKPAAGMEEQTKDMGGAGIVAGAMHALAARGAAANVVGLVGLVENMPGARAMRPGDVLTSMKGDTVEVISTDGEGRLILGDVMWYAQEHFGPAAIIDLATLTGAIVVALGHERAGIYSTHDDLCSAFLEAAEAEGEGAWRMPLGKAYADLLKSSIADVKNVSGRTAGSITAAEFLRRFVMEGTPWLHIDVAGVTRPATETALAPKGASGWGVLALDRLVRERFEA